MLRVCKSLCVMVGGARVSCRFHVLVSIIIPSMSDLYFAEAWFDVNK